MSSKTEPQSTPLHDVHVEAGATFTDFGGWQMPLKYGSELSEHKAVRTSAGLFDLSHMGEVRITGPQSAEALDYALTARVSNVAPGRAKYSLICTESGTILDDLIVYRLDEGEDESAREFLVVPNAGNASAVAAALTERSAGFEATVRNESAQTALVAIQGPEAARILAEVLPQDEATALPELKYYAARPVTVRTGDTAVPDGGDVRVLLARTGYTGEDGFELIIGPVADRGLLSTSATAVWKALLQAADSVGAELLPCGLASRDSLRLEAGMPLYGNELGLGHLPSESGAGMAVPLKSKETDFVGRDALLAAREAGTGTTTGQTIVALKADGRRAARAGYAVLDGDGNQVGVVTSGIPSPTLGYPIALARVDVAHREPGTQLAVDLRGKAEPFTVVELPFYRRPA